MPEYYTCARIGSSAVYHHYPSKKAAQRSIKEDVKVRVGLGEKWVRDSDNYYRRNDGMVMEVVEDGE